SSGRYQFTTSTITVHAPAYAPACIELPQTPRSKEYSVLIAMFESPGSVYLNMPARSVYVRSLVRLGTPDGITCSVAGSISDFPSAKNPTRNGPGGLGGAMIGPANVPSENNVAAAIKVSC